MPRKNRLPKKCPEQCNFYENKRYCSNLDMHFEPLTIDIAARNIGKKIYYYYRNCECICGDTKDKKNKTMEELFEIYFIPNGDLEYSPNGFGFEQSIVYKDWLRNQDTFTLKPEMYVSLLGIVNYDEEEDLGLQISDPFEDGPWEGIRPLSDNSIGGENYVVRGYY